VRIRSPMHGEVRRAQKPGHFSGVLRWWLHDDQRIEPKWV
jgi:hypothetical protein